MNELNVESLSGYEELHYFEREQLAGGRAELAVLPRRLVFTAVRRGGLALRISTGEEAAFECVILPGRFRQEACGWLYLARVLPAARTAERKIAEAIARQMQNNGLGRLLIPLADGDNVLREFWERAGDLATLGREEDWFTMPEEGLKSAAELMVFDWSDRHE
jgi:hypothetical protein